MALRRPWLAAALLGPMCPWGRPMRDYGRVFSAIWASDDFRALTEDGRALVLYLLTCQHGTLAGVFRLPDGYVGEDLQWGHERVAEGFANIATKGFATRCEATKWVWVCKYLEWNPLENPNQRKAAVKLSDQVPGGCQWRQAFRRVCGQEIGLEAEPLANPSATLPESVLGAVEGTGEGEGTGTQKPKSPANPPDAPAPPAAAADAPVTKGKRIADDWALPRLWGAWAVANYPHWTADTVRKIATGFHNHFKAKSGKDATKLDWKATWENWCDSGITQRDYPAPKTAPDREAENARIVAEAREIYARQNGAARNDHNTIDA